jgi:membrane associated rhomboid family serine protease
MFVGSMWLGWVVGVLWPGAPLALGILPRSQDGLDGILFAPLLHADLEHLVANSVPLIVLGALVLWRGIVEFVFVILVSGFVAGVGTWLLGTGNTAHIGASGIVFGLFGYLLLRAAYDRRLSSVVVTLIVAGVYGSSILYGLVPDERVSWSAHVFGFVGGFLAARSRYGAWGRQVAGQRATYLR